MPAFLTSALASSLYKRVGSKQVANGAVTVSPTIYTYGRDYYQDQLTALFANRASGMVSLGVATNASMLVIGSGFGYLMEALVTQGVTNVWGIDPGSLFWDVANDLDWASGMKARTAEDWIGSGTEQASLNALGIPGQATFNWVIDEDAAPAHSDAELPIFIAGCEARLQGNAKGRIVHLVTPLGVGGPGDSSQNWKTMTAWKAVAPDHTWVNVGTGEIQA